MLFPFQVTTILLHMAPLMHIFVDLLSRIYGQND